MAATKGTIHFWYADVDYSFEPTERDQVGCDGMYIERVRVKWYTSVLVNLMLVGLVGLLGPELRVRRG